MFTTKKRTLPHNFTLNSFTSQSRHGGELRRRFRESACDAQTERSGSGILGVTERERRRTHKNTFLAKKTVEQKSIYRVAAVHD